MKAGERVRAWRKERHLALEAVARELGVATSTVHRLERGQSVPSLATATALERLTGIPASAWVENEQTEE